MFKKTPQMEMRKVWRLWPHQAEISQFHSVLVLSGKWVKAGPDKGSLMSSILSELLREKRTAVNLRLRDAEACGVSNAYLSQLENGKIKKPSPFILKKLAKLYDCNFEELMVAAQYIESAVMSVKCSKCGSWVEVKCAKETP